MTTPWGRVLFAGGPWDGRVERIQLGPVFEVAETKPLPFIARVDVEALDPVELEASFRRRRYRLEQVAWRYPPWVAARFRVHPDGNAWVAVIDQPLEQRELAMTRIIGPLRLIQWWASLSSA